MLEAEGRILSKWIPPWLPDWLTQLEERKLIERAQVLLKQWGVLEKEVMPDAPRGLRLSHPEFSTLNIIPKITAYEKWVKNLDLGLDPSTTRERFLKELAVYAETRDFVTKVLQAKEGKSTKAATVPSIIPPDPKPKPLPSPLPRPPFYESDWFPIVLGGGAALTFVYWLSRYMR